MVNWKLLIQGVFLTAAINWILLAHMISLPFGWRLAAGLTAISAIILFLFYPQRRIFETKRLKQLNGGSCLLILFLLSMSVSCLFALWGWLALQIDWKVWVLHLLFVGAAEFLMFWDGMIRIFVTSVQLGMKWRIIGALTGWIPVVNLLVLCHMLSLVRGEIQAEEERFQLDQTRAERQICHTKYPILLVHGVFFRDFRYFNYWGRIPMALKRNGAEIYYGNQQSAASVACCGEELAERILQVLKESGAEKVNIIAHSKGGLDSCYAVSQKQMAPYVASVTTVNTPHQGCKFADYLLEKIPASVRERIARAYNRSLKKLGDKDPDFLEAVKDLTASGCNKLQDKLLIPKGVYCQSVASKLNRPSGGRFPLNFSHRFVQLFDGENDGLVSFASMRWGEKCYEIRVNGRRGVSHGDVIDLNRENIAEFDVREFYINLVQDLKERGF